MCANRMLDFCAGRILICLSVSAWHPLFHSLSLPVDGSYGPLVFELKGLLLLLNRRQLPGAIGGPPIA